MAKQELLIQQAGKYDLVLKANEQARVCILQQTADQNINLNISLTGPRARVKVYQLQTGQQQQIIKSDIKIYHQAKATESYISTYSILNDQSQAYTASLIKIDPGATASDSFTEHRTLLLSAQAQIFPTPALEIDNHEVKAAHAATVKNLDELDLLYLQSRGLALTTAVKILTNAFILDILSKFPLSTRSNIQLVSPITNHQP